jgi:tetratricopeptide (TPR) repeat protein
VASRTSAFSFKGSKVDIPTVAQKLNVATILEGSVRKAGKRVRITAQLIQVATDSHLWSDTYDRELEDIFAVQDDIAQSVVKELRSALLGEKRDASASATVKAEVHAAAKGRGENVEAYRLYLQGRFFEDRSTREGAAKGIEYYRQALELDPQYALAWAGLSRSYASQAGSSWSPITEGFAKARAAAERALQFEPDRAESQLAMGWIRMYHDWDWKAADSFLRRAVELAPADAQALRDMGILAGFLGRLDEAVALLRRAAVLDPLSAQVHRSLGRWCYCAGLLEEADAALRKTLELNPLGARTHHYLGAVRLTQGRLDEALDEFQREGHDTFRLLGLALVQHARGEPAQSDAALRELSEKDPEGSAYQIAQGHAYCGATDLAFEWLKRAQMQRDPGLGIMKHDPLLDNLHGDPRWQPFLEKMGLADRA